MNTTNSNTKAMPGTPAVQPASSPQALLSAIDRALADVPIPEPAMRYEAPCWTQVKWGRILWLELTKKERGAIREHEGELARIDALIESVQPRKAREKLLADLKEIEMNPTQEAIDAFDKSRLELERSYREKHSALKRARQNVLLQFARTVGIEIMRRAAEHAARIVDEIATAESKAARILGVTFEESTTLAVAKQALAPLTQYVSNGVATIDAVRAILPEAELSAIAQGN